MRIERVDESTVKCYLSIEELKEYEIDYKDFLTRSEKAKEVVHEIIAQAKEEVGYRMPKFAFDMQIMMMPEQGVVLTLSEKDPVDLNDKQQALNYLNELKKMFQRAKEQLGVEESELEENAESSESESGNFVPGTREEDEDSAAQNQPNASKAKEFAGTEYVIFRFENLRDVMAYADVIPANLRVTSALYTMNGGYYLEICKGCAAYARFSRACAQAMEFAKLYVADAGKALYLKEHGTCLIEEGALKKLRF